MMLPIGINDKKIIGMFVAAFMLYLFFKRKGIKEFQYLGITFMIVSVFSVLGALGMESAPRYSYLPSCILIIFLLYGVLQFVEVRSKIYLVKICMLIIVFSFNVVYYRSKLLSHTEPVKGPPVWKEEVARWREDKSYMPQVRPVLDNGELRMKLSK
jgi:hypothetical protein